VRVVYTSPAGDVHTSEPEVRNLRYNISESDELNARQLKAVIGDLPARKLIATCQMRSSVGRWSLRAVGQSPLLNKGNKDYWLQSSRFVRVTDTIVSSVPSDRFS
jgi:hypothetical protein